MRDPPHARFKLYGEGIHEEHFLFIFEYSTVLHIDHASNNLQTWLTHHMHDVLNALQKVQQINDASKGI